MSDSTLLACGVAISFIALAGIYVYLRECWTAQEETNVQAVLDGKIESFVEAYLQWAAGVAKEAQRAAK